MDWLLYSVGLISVIQQHELAIGVHMSPPSWISFPPLTLSHPSRLFQSPCLSSLSHTANFHCLFTCVSVYASTLLSPSISPSLASLLPLSASLFRIPASPLLPGAFKKYIYILAKPRGIWDLSSLTKDQTSSLCIESIDSQPLDQKGAPSAFVHFKPKFVHSEGYQEKEKETIKNSGN